MFQKALVYLGLRAAPSPIRQYAASTATFGVVPVLAYVAWKNRDKIASVYRNLTAKAEQVAQTTTSSVKAARSNGPIHAVPLS